jgi:hypothetical protein
MPSVCAKAYIKMQFRAHGAMSLARAVSGLPKAEEQYRTLAIAHFLASQKHAAKRKSMQPKCVILSV